jgi:anti-anti-sigma factor
MCRIALHGDFDSYRKDELQTTFDSVPPELDVVVDLGGVTYLDSTFLHQLARLYRRRSEGATITLQQANEQIRHILQLVGFDELFLASSDRTKFANKTKDLGRTTPEANAETCIPN